MSTNTDSSYVNVRGARTRASGRTEEPDPSEALHEAHPRPRRRRRRRGARRGRRGAGRRPRGQRRPGRLRCAGRPGGGAPAIGTAALEPGTALVDGAGRALYLFEADTGTTSTCNGRAPRSGRRCSPRAAPTSGAAQAALVGTTTRADGTQPGHLRRPPALLLRRRQGPGRRPRPGHPQLRRRLVRRRPGGRRDRPRRPGPRPGRGAPAGPRLLTGQGSAQTIGAAASTSGATASATTAARASACRPAGQPVGRAQDAVDPGERVRAAR